MVSGGGRRGGIAVLWLGALSLGVCTISLMDTGYVDFRLKRWGTSYSVTDTYDSMLDDGPNALIVIPTPSNDTLRTLQRLRHRDLIPILPITLQSQLNRPTLTLFHEDGTVLGEVDIDETALPEFR